MKIKFQYIILGLGLSLMASSCHDESPSDSGQEKKGTVSLTGVEVSTAEDVDNTQETLPGSKAVVDISQYIVEFYKQGASKPVETYAYIDMPGTVELAEGVYTVSVRSHDLQKAEWEKPYFAGESAEFRVEANKLTEVEPITCTFRSLKVSVVFGEKLRAAMESDVKVTVVANDEGRLEYLPSDGRAGYFATVDGSATLVATFTGTVKGRQENFFRTYTGVKAGQHRIIKYELGADLPMGFISDSGLSIDVTYEDVAIDGTVNPGGEDALPDDDEPGTLPGLGGDDNPDSGDDDDPDAQAAITFTGTIEDGATYYNTDFVDESGSVLKEAEVYITCAKGCADLVVNINSNTLTPDVLESVGLSADFSLVTSTQFFEALGGLGLPCGSDVVGVSTPIKFNITQFMSLLGIYAKGTSVFTLTVTDQDGNSKACQFTILTH